MSQNIKEINNCYVFMSLMNIIVTMIYKCPILLIMLIETI